MESPVLSQLDARGVHLPLKSRFAGMGIFCNAITCPESAC